MPPVIINGIRIITTLNGSEQVIVPNCVMIPDIIKTSIPDPLNFHGIQIIHYKALDQQTGEVLDAAGSPAQVEIQSIPADRLFNGIRYDEFLEIYKEVVKYIVSEHLKPVPDPIPAPEPEEE